MLPHRTIKLAEQPTAVPFPTAVATKLTARVAELIAKPGKTDELRSLLCQSVTPLIRDRTGFVRTIVMTNQKERRRVAVITFWSTEEQAVNDPWEDTPLVRELLSPLIDTWSSTRTYEVDFTEATDTHSQAITVPVC
jgi:heme-degrading monooxygenase HmoA